MFVEVTLTTRRHCFVFVTRGIVLRLWFFKIFCPTHFSASAIRKDFIVTTVWCDFFWYFCPRLALSTLQPIFIYVTIWHLYCHSALGKSMLPSSARRKSLVKSWTVMTAKCGCYPCSLDRQLSLSEKNSVQDSDYLIFRPFDPFTLSLTINASETFCL